MRPPLPRALAAGVLLCCAALPLRAAAGDGDGRAKSLVATRTSSAPRIDGVLDEPMWLQIPERDDFLQAFPGRGVPPLERTSVRAAYDDADLYFGVFCFDAESQSLERQVSRRDRALHTDEVEISLDTYGDGRTALRFALSVGGVQRDGALYNDLDYDPQWDGVWEGRTLVTPEGWSAEIRIPFSQLPRGESAHGFGLQIRRFRRSSNETLAWVYVPPWERGEVSRYGRLDGISGIRPDSRLEVVPFAAARRRTPAPGEEALGRSGLTGSAGLDLRYRTAPNFALTATLNPDFGQVELDQVVLNLSTFETFYPEKRPFFLEGAGFFATPFTVFHSRRIGQAPGPPALEDPSGDTLLHQPEETTILGAAKWTGKTASGLTVGLLQAVTQSERASARRADGTLYEIRVAPQTSHSVVRLKQDFLRNSAVGVIATLSDAQDGREAAAAGVDWSLRLRDNEYLASGQLLRARVSDSGPSSDGTGGVATLAREGGLHWRWDVSHRWLSPDIDFNDLGFQSRPDLRETSGVLTYREDRPGERLQGYSVALLGISAHNRSGADFNRVADLNASVELKNFWDLSGSLARQFEILDDRETRGGPLFRVPALDSVGLSVASDPRRRWQANFSLDLGEEYDGSFWIAGAGAGWRSGRRLEIGASFEALRSTGSQRWVETVVDAGGTPHYIFGDLDQRSIDLNLDGTFGWTPALSLTGRVQVFAADVDYSAFKELVSPERLERTPEAAAFSSEPDFRSADWNAQLVLRWEYRPGSFLTFVTTRRQGVFEPEAASSLGRTLRELGGKDGETVALLKLSYWWNP